MRACVPVYRCRVHLCTMCMHFNEFNWIIYKYTLLSFNCLQHLFLLANRVVVFLFFYFVSSFCNYKIWVSWKVTLDNEHTKKRKKTKRKKKKKNVHSHHIIGFYIVSHTTRADVYYICSVNHCTKTYLLWLAITDFFSIIISKYRRINVNHFFLLAS